MGYLIGVVLLLWLMSKAKSKPKKSIKKVKGELVYLMDIIDDLTCRVEELEEMVKEMKG